MEQESKEIFNIVYQVLSDFASVIPNVIGAFFVILIGWIVAKIFSKSLRKVLQKVGVDKMAQRLNDTEFVQKAKVNVIPSTLLSKIVYYFLMLIVLMAGTQVLQMDIISQMMGDLISFIPKLLTALLLFVIGILLADFIKNITLTTCNSLGIPSSKVIANFIFYLVFLTITITALEQASIQTTLISTNLTIIVAGLVGAFAIGYGFASKDTMANFLASFYTKNKVKVGDVIRLGDVSGEVIMVDSSSLSLQAKDRIIIIPLKKLTSENLEILNN